MEPAKTCEQEQSVAAPRYVSAAEVATALTWPLVNAAVEQAFRAISSKATTTSNDAKELVAHQPQRILTPCGRNGLLFAMPGYVGNYKSTADDADAMGGATTTSTLACKLVTSFPGNEQRPTPLPNILAHILLFSTRTGQLECVLEGTQITGWRTAAASIVATRVLYFDRFQSPRSIKLAIVGVGTQGRSHALGMCATYAVSDVFLWNRTATKALAFADELRRTVGSETQVHVTDTAALAVADADVICVGTYAAQALITAEMLPQGRPLHINTVGAGQVHFGEVAQDIYDRAKVYVDSAGSAKVELRDLKAHIVGEVGEVLLGGAAIPAHDDITIFQSMGMAAEDATVAQYIFDKIK